MDELAKLQEWYFAQCDGDWEHAWGVEIGTLDNPGWSLRISLEDTRLADVPYERRKVETSELEWMHCWVEDQTVQAAGGPRMLTAMLAEFFRWADQHQ
jgi:hypothetical protein